MLESIDGSGCMAAGNCRNRANSQLHECLLWGNGMAMARHGMAQSWRLCLHMAWHGVAVRIAWHGMAWRGMAWHGCVWHGRDMARCILLATVPRFKLSPFHPLHPSPCFQSPSQIAGASTRHCSCALPGPSSPATTCCSPATSLMSELGRESEHARPVCVIVWHAGWLLCACRVLKE